MRIDVIRKSKGVLNRDDSSMAAIDSNLTFILIRTAVLILLLALDRCLTLFKEVFIPIQELKRSALGDSDDEDTSNGLITNETRFSTIKFDRLVEFVELDSPGIGEIEWAEMNGRTDCRNQTIRNLSKADGKMNSLLILTSSLLLNYPKVRKILIVKRGNKSKENSHGTVIFWLGGQRPRGRRFRHAEKLMKNRCLKREVVGG